MSLASRKQAKRHRNVHKLNQCKPELIEEVRRTNEIHVQPVRGGKDNSNRSEVKTKEKTTQSVLAAQDTGSTNTKIRKYIQINRDVGCHCVDVTS